MTTVCGRQIAGNGGTRVPLVEWRDWLVQEFGSRGWRLAPDGAVFSGEDERAAVSFSSVEEVQRSYADRSWLAMSHPCPWIEKVLGFVQWRNVKPLPLLARTSFPEQLIEICWGRTVHLASGECREPVVPISTPLTAFRRTFRGLERDRLLSLDPRYLSAIAQDASTLSRQLGIATPVEVIEDNLIESHRYTPVQFSVDEDEPLLDPAGGPIPNEQSLLEAHSIEIWGFDTQLLKREAGLWWSK